MFDRLGRAPEVDDTVSVDGYRLTVEDVDGARISSVVVRKESEESGEVEESSPPE